MQQSKPWYREPWPWILRSGPALVIIASFISAWIAIRSDDGLVEDDYYRKGLAAEKTVARSELAAKQGIEARVKLQSDRVSVAVSAIDTTFKPPVALILTMSHPTRAGMDQVVTLKLENQEFTGAFRLPSAGHWLVMIEDEARTWRLMGNVVLPASGETVIGGVQPADIRHQH
ncbi:MAG TPA: FixH family protein [Rhodocyclaceae bacterium]